MLGFGLSDLTLGINLFKLNVRDRYLGSSLGSFWAIANPLFMLGLYTFVFGFVLKVRLPGAETTLAYVIWLISGYGPWISTVEAIMSSSNSIVGSTGIIKNIALKTELLPISATFVGLINLGVSLVFLLVLMAVSGNLPGWHIVLLPLIVALQFLFLVAVGIWLSALTVFVRDLAQILPNILTVMMFVTPIFYSVDQMPAIVARLSVINPFYQMADAYRQILIVHAQPNWAGVLYLSFLSLFLLLTGLRTFRRVKFSFESML